MTGVEMIAAERARQVSAEDYTSDHDDEHVGGEIAIAAACYAVYGRDVREAIVIEREGLIQPDGCDRRHPYFYGDDAFPWPGDKRADHSRLRRLVIAGALLAAEIDRLQRKAKP